MGGQPDKLNWWVGYLFRGWNSCALFCPALFLLGYYICLLFVCVDASMWHYSNACHLHVCVSRAQREPKLAVNFSLLLVSCWHDHACCAASRDYADVIILSQLLASPFLQKCWRKHLFAAPLSVASYCALQNRNCRWPWISSLVAPSVHTLQLVIPRFLFSNFFAALLSSTYVHHVRCTEESVPASCIFGGTLCCSFVGNAMQTLCSCLSFLIVRK